MPRPSRSSTSPGDLATEQSLSAVLLNEVESIDEPHSDLSVGAGPLASAARQSGGFSCF
jgi:hypothetical protein